MTDASPTPSLATFARGKLVRVLGEVQGARAYDQALSGAKLTAIETPEDLRLFAEMLSTQGGMTAAVGSILSVAAVLRGAKTV